MCRLESEGYYGDVRLLMAICKIFNAYYKDNDIKLHEPNFTLSNDTNIPRQVRPSIVILFPLIFPHFVAKFDNVSNVHHNYNTLKAKGIVLLIKLSNDIQNLKFDVSF